MDLETPITTQEELDAVLKDSIDRASRKAAREAAERYADYDDLKAKAEKAEKGAARIAELERAAAERDRADRAREEREKAARETGVPVDLIRGDTPEEVAAHAKAIAAAYAKPAAPRVGEAGRFQRGDSGGSKTVDFVNRLTGNSKND